MVDVAKHEAIWQKKKDETFRIRFNLNEAKQKRVHLTTQENIDHTTKEHWVEFKMWDYEMMINLRKKATRYHNESGSFYVDHDLFNDLKINYLLQSWSFGEVDPHMELHHSNGILTDESFRKFKSLYPWVVTAIIQKMNQILEGYSI